MLTRIYKDNDGRAWLLAVEGDKWARTAEGAGLGIDWLEGIAEGLHLLGELSEKSFYTAIWYAMSELRAGVKCERV
jgi:hypothetical protein